MQIYGKSDKGLLRETNQDAFAYEVLSENAFFAVVCDGMGGANAGNVASEYAVRVISDYLLRSYKSGMSSAQIENIMRSAVYSANTAVFQAAGKDENLKGMGTTAVLLLIEGNTGYILHIGDSRAYSYSRSILSQLTVDHSVVQNMIDSGEITPDEAKIHPSKNIITRALGVANEVHGDLDFIDLNADDIILLCSDGLSNFVSVEDISQALDEFDENIASKLIDKANAGGGGDNITAVVIKI